MKLKTKFIDIKLSIILVFFSSQIFAQTSIRDLKSINAELDKFKSELTDLPIVESSLTVDTKDKILDAEKALDDVTIAVGTEILDTGDFYFGYDYFKKDIDFFDNIPIPSDYILGPGDEIVISLWGEMNSRESFLINKNGQIFYEGVGFINISNRTILKAEEILSRELGKIYSTLEKNKQSTELSIELGRLKSLNIYFSGLVVNPGINLVHPFSDIFTALVQSGGVDLNGSLRNIEIIRDNRTIAKIDLYDFFSSGNKNNLNYKLIDGDVIHIPPIKSRTMISGAIKKPGYYEILENDSLFNLIQYAAGLEAMASSSGITMYTVTPIEQRTIDDKAISSINVNFKDSKNISLNNVASVIVRKLGEIESEVEIFGKVKNPGLYSATGSSLKDILDIAGGFDDPIFRKSIDDKIVILRKDENNFFGQEFKIPYSESDNFELKINDKIFVYENINYKNSFIYRVEGQVNKPGTYPFNRNNITVREALSSAGGLTDLGSERNLVVLVDFSRNDEEGNEIITKKRVNNVSLDFQIGINSVIIASPIENVVNIEGNVYNPGLVTYTKGLRYPDYIELSGGYKPDTLKRRIHIKRANGSIEKVGGLLISRTKKIYPGDTIIVPINENSEDFDFTTFISNLSTTLANLAAIVLIVDNKN